jgi:benzoyl-CoA reductase/2-hydroxyglutaryl-CoA dehydratase subunit BcrC/BadD/HgdB
MEQDLRHALGNARAETQALKSLLLKAADRLEDVVEAKCSDESLEKALSMAKRVRAVIARVDGPGETSAQS